MLKPIISDEVIRMLAESVPDSLKHWCASQYAEHYDQAFVEKVVDALGLSPYPQASLCEDPSACEDGLLCVWCGSDLWDRDEEFLFVYMEQISAEHGVAGLAVCDAACANLLLREHPFQYA